MKRSGRWWFKTEMKPSMNLLDEAQLGCLAERFLDCTPIEANNQLLVGTVGEGALGAPARRPAEQSRAAGGRCAIVPASQGPGGGSTRWV